MITSAEMESAAQYVLNNSPGQLLDELPIPVQDVIAVFVTQAKPVDGMISDEVFTSSIAKVVCLMYRVIKAREDIVNTN